MEKGRATHLRPLLLPSLLQVLPADIGALTELRTLDLSRNQLRGLPEARCLPGRRVDVPA